MGGDAERHETFPRRAWEQEASFKSTAVRARKKYGRTVKVVGKP